LGAPCRTRVLHRSRFSALPLLQGLGSRNRKRTHRQYTGLVSDTSAPATNLVRRRCHHRSPGPHLYIAESPSGFTSQSFNRRTPDSSPTTGRDFQHGSTSTQDAQGKRNRRNTSSSSEGAGDISTAHATVAKSDAAKQHKETLAAKIAPPAPTKRTDLQVSKSQKKTTRPTQSRSPQQQQQQHLSQYRHDAQNPTSMQRVTTHDNNNNQSPITQRRPTLRIANSSSTPSLTPTPAPHSNIAT
jgi:hypothetical protein